MSKLKILRINTSLLDISEDESKILKRLNASVIEVKGNEVSSENYDIDALMVISAKVGSDIIKNLQKCKIIARIGIGTDKIDIAEATKKKIIVTNVPDFCSNELADHTIALILACARKIVLLDKKFREGDYWSIGFSSEIKRLAGKNMGLIGFGKLARNVAERAIAFGLKISAYDPFIDLSVMKKQGVVKINSMDEILKNSDFLSLHLPLNNDTIHLLVKKEFEIMNPTAILINTARGAIIDEEALIEALTQKKILAAGLMYLKAGFI